MYGLKARFNLQNPWICPTRVKALPVPLPVPVLVTGLNSSQLCWSWAVEMGSSTGTRHCICKIHLCCHHFSTPNPAPAAAWTQLPPTGDLCWGWEASILPERVGRSSSSSINTSLFVEAWSLHCFPLGEDCAHMLQQGSDRRGADLSCLTLA